MHLNFQLHTLYKNLHEENRSSVLLKVKAIMTLQNTARYMFFYPLILFPDIICADTMFRLLVLTEKHDEHVLAERYLCLLVWS